MSPLDFSIQCATLSQNLLVHIVKKPFMNHYKSSSKTLDAIIVDRGNHVLSSPVQRSLKMKKANISDYCLHPRERIDVTLSPLPPQFVPFRDYMDRTGNHVLSMARLAKDVLAEIPDQFISYMKSRGIKPNPAPPPYTPPGHTHHHTQI